MSPRFSKKRLILGPLLAVAALSLWVLPISEIVSAISFQWSPDRARASHLIRLEDPASGQEILILGTVHYQHVETDRYPLSMLESVIAHSEADLLLVEIHPESSANGRWAEGPIEMPYCALVAGELGIDVKGMDDWSTDHGLREDRMVENILSATAVVDRTLVVTGFSHVRGFRERLEQLGFQLADWPLAERRALFEHPVDPGYPAGLRDAYQFAIDRAQQEKTPFLDPEWIQRRTVFLETLPER